MFMEIFKENKTKNNTNEGDFSASVLVGEKSPHEKLRKKILVFYELGLILSFIMVMMSPLMANVPYNYNVYIVYLIFLSVLSLPFFIIASIKLSKKSLRWFLLPLIPIAIFIISSMIGDELQIHSQIQSQPQPLSTRGLPVPVTDVPVALPPDPGEAGKATLAGIDSNNDGVRDDLEREIVYMYPQNDQVRRVLRSMIKKEQEVITTEGDHDHFKALMVSYFSFQNCYDNLVIKERILNGVDNLTNLSNMVKNTSERSKMFNKNAKKAEPYDYIGGNCDQPLVQGQY